MTSIRLPAYPLVVHDPGLSVWMTTDHPAESWPKHWTGAIRGGCVMARVDGVTFDLLGPQVGKKAELIKREILPLTTRFTFAAGGCELVLSYVSPLLPDDLDLLSQPVCHVSVSARSTDGRDHTAQIYTDVGIEWATDIMAQSCRWGRARLKNGEMLRAATVAQPGPVRPGDNIRTDWGHVALVLPSDQAWIAASGPDAPLRQSFVDTGTVVERDCLRQPETPNQEHAKLVACSDFGSVGKTASERRWLIAYDDDFCLEYLFRKVRPYWQRNGLDFGSMIEAAITNSDAILARCAHFDKELLAQCERSGGEHYRDLCAASYRQAVAAHKLAADLDGTPLFFSKENFSNGCIATVDVTYPSAPLFLLTNPDLLAAMVEPVLRYAQSPRWRFPFAPHDLGTFPCANGQVYGGGETSERDQMPIEECGNMLILVGTLCRARSDARWAKPYWTLLRQWADYCIAHGVDPENQLCTDDFAGHLGHNANLAIKAILGVGCAAQLAEAIGEPDEGERLRREAERMTSEWMQLAADDDHTRLTYDRADSWSQKYNLVWDRLLGLNLFPASVAASEAQYYRRKQQTYGLPLDDRKTYTKLDWIVWSACLSGQRGDFEALVEPLWKWLQATPTRVPMTDWYDTITGAQVGFQARSVVGGVFLQALAQAWQAPAAASARG
jgi:hypothetical protein